jgi:pyridinium-3,5-biscarboxylic acid mononucleotide synthase
MNADTVKDLLNRVQSGAISIDDAFQRLRHLPFEDLGFAKVDHHRSIRCGFPEVIYCEGKTVEQVVSIVEARLRGDGNVLGTRATQQMFDAVKAVCPEAEYHTFARAITVRRRPAKWSKGIIGLVAAGTSDMPVAEEARVTCQIMDQTVETFFDVGVAGLHRLLSHSEAIQRARVVIVVAGMEGALAGVVGGLVSAPVIAVPTSIGYGASFGGIAPLLTMLNSCAAGVAVVNIDSGFNAGYLAATINRLGEKPE